MTVSGLNGLGKLRRSSKSRGNSGKGQLSSESEYQMKSKEVQQRMARRHNVQLYKLDHTQSAFYRRTDLFSKNGLEGSHGC